MPLIPLPLGNPAGPMPPGLGAPPAAAPAGPGPPPAALAGMAAMSLAPQQEAQQAALTAQQTQEVLAALMSQLASAPNPAAEAAQSMPAAQVTPDSGVPVDTNSISGGGGY